MVKKLLVITLSPLFSCLYSQQTLWQTTLKSDTQNFLSDLVLTADGQYLLSGSSIPTVDVQSTEKQSSSYDYHLVKLNQQGKTLWEKYFSGDKNDFLSSTTATLDGGFLLSGTSYSSGAKEKKQTNSGGSDLWVIKIDENGEEQWQKTFGTIKNEEAKKVVQTRNKGFIIASEVQNKNSGFGEKDGWVLKLDALGNLISQMYLGGSSVDEISDLIPTRDGGCLIGLYSQSGISKVSSFRNIPSNTQNDTDIKLVAKEEDNFGEGDFWIVKLDEKFNVQWQKSFGGKKQDRIKAMKETNFGFVIAGESNSPSSGNKTEQEKQGEDLWVLSLDPFGREKWQKSFDFSKRDVLMSLDIITESSSDHTKGILLGGYSQAEGRIEENEETFWMLYVNENGEEVWRKHIEGKEKRKEERLVSTHLTREGSYVLAGTSAMQLGQENWKILKLQDKQVEDLFSKKEIQVFPNPVEDYFYVDIGLDFQEASIQVYDMSGRALQTKTTTNKTTKVDARSLPQGAYIISIKTNDNKVANSKIVKK